MLFFASVFASSATIETESPCAAPAVGSPFPVVTKIVDPSEVIAGVLQMLLQPESPQTGAFWAQDKADCR